MLHLKSKLMQDISILRAVLKISFCRFSILGRWTKSRNVSVFCDTWWTAWYRETRW